MKCARCGNDCTYSERSDGRCPKCSKYFAFEPRTGDKFSDVAFQSAIDAVSAKGSVRWGVEHLYYELCRRLRKARGVSCLVSGVTILLAIGIGGSLLDVPLVGYLFGGLGAIVVLAVLAKKQARKVPLEISAFNLLWARWQQVHEVPPSVIVRNPRKKSERAAEPDLEDYSFDRAVICNRARTVDLLLANNFHFENNCAVLAITGYPLGPFEVVRKMLKRNPRLHVFALHDASPDGCRLAHRLANDPEWFKGQAKVVDVGLRPGHAKPFIGLLLPAAGPVTAGNGITESEAAWLSSYILELAAIRPEQVLKRLFKAMNRKGEEADWGTGVDSGSGGGFGDGSGVEIDSDSFGTDADASDGGADGFG